MLKVNAAAMCENVALCSQCSCARSFDRQEVMLNLSFWPMTPKSQTMSIMWVVVARKPLGFGHVNSVACSCTSNSVEEAKEMALNYESERQKVRVQEKEKT